MKRKKNFIKKRTFILTISTLSFILVNGILLTIILKNSSSSPTTHKSLAVYAKEVIEQCKDSSSRSNCYDQTIPSLMNKISMEDAFKTTQLIQKEDSSYTYCHTLGHRLSVAEVKKDPSKWEEVLPRCPSGVCSNGCLHGVLEEKFKSTYSTDEKQLIDITQQLKNVCEKRSSFNPTGLEQATCYHALGHIAMYLTNIKPMEAVSICDTLGVKEDGRDFRSYCYDAIFMHMFQPLDPTDLGPVKDEIPTKETVRIYCETFPDLARGSCISESWALYGNDIKNPEKFESHCQSILDEKAQYRCYSALVFVVTTLFDFDTNKIINFCQNLSTSLQRTCFTNAAARMVEADYNNANRSLSICEGAPASLRGSCYRELAIYTTYNYKSDSIKAKSLCNSLPKEWRTLCSK